MINGGVNGLADRLKYWRRNRELLGLPWRDPNEERLEIIRFQQHHGLAADGIAGPKTLAVVKSIERGR